ncbi:MAG: hypothetical protein ABIS92_15490 [Polyangia bacterium]
MIEVRYAGVVVGRSAIVRELDTRGLFLGITEPMPVGTPVILRIAERGGTDIHGKVELVSESQELVHAGMRVRFADPTAATLFGTPVQAPPEPEQPVAPPAAAVPAAAVSASPAVSAEAMVATGDRAAVDAATGASPTGSHRRIVIDASADRARAEATAANPEPADDEGDSSGAVGSATAGDAPGTGGGTDGRIPAPDPGAFSGGGGKKGRRNRRR